MGGAYKASVAGVDHARVRRASCRRRGASISQKRLDKVNLSSSDSLIVCWKLRRRLEIREWRELLAPAARLLLLSSPQLNGRYRNSPSGPSLSTGPDNSFKRFIVMWYTASVGLEYPIGLPQKIYGRWAWLQTSLWPWTKCTHKLAWFVSDVLIYDPRVSLLYFYNEVHAG